MSEEQRQRWKDYWATQKWNVSAFARRVVPLLRESKCKTVLDLGCGDGTDSLFFAQSGFTVTAMDISESGIERLRKNADDQGKAITTIVGDHSHTLPFKDGTFDAVYAHLSIHYFDDAMTDAVFAEIRRVIKTDGLFLVKTKSVDDPWYGKGEQVGPDMFKMEHVRHFFRKEYMIEKLTRADLHIVHVRRLTGKYHGHMSRFIEAIAKR